MQTVPVNPPVKRDPVLIENISRTDLTQSAYHLLETYSNVHRGSGQNSFLTTHLYEQARNIVLNYLNLNSRTHSVIFATPARTYELTALLSPEDYIVLSPVDFGLMLGVRAIAVKRDSLPQGVPCQSGGGTTKLYSKDWVIWAPFPDKFEAGTPPIVNIVLFAKVLIWSKDQINKKVTKDKDIESTVYEILYQELKDGRGKDLLQKLREKLIGKDIKVPTLKGAAKFINLDNSASTRTFEPIFNSFSKAMFQGEKTRQLLTEEVRLICADVLGAPLKDYDIIFTSNTTESINFIAHNLPAVKGDGREPLILNTILEHSSNDLPWRNIPGYRLIRMNVDRNGFYNLNELEEILKNYNTGSKRVILAAVNAASNVLGSCNDLKSISRIVHKYGAYLLVDAAQLAAHRKINIEEDGIDFLAFSGHKIYAPFGTGVLAAKKGLLDFNKDSLERMRLSGEENPGGIAALGKALLLLNQAGFDLITEEEQKLTAGALRALSEIPGIKIHGICDPGVPEFRYKIGVISFEIKGKIPGSLAKQLAASGGIGVRYGCHCAHLVLKYILNFTPLQEKIQKLAVKLVPPLKLQGVIRISFGLENNQTDSDALIRTLKEIITKPAAGEKMTKKEYKKRMKEYMVECMGRVYGS